MFTLDWLAYTLKPFQLEQVQVRLVHTQEKIQPGGMLDLVLECL